jgi:metal-responsive CopG/Arc/MetJ family transcriptional regulator
MKRLQVMIEEDLYRELERLAAQESTSKSGLIRRFVREHATPLRSTGEDPIWEIVGVDDPESEPMDRAAHR